MKFVLASNNKNKLIEMKMMLSDLGIEVVSQQEAGFLEEVEETGTTFYENALIKAEAASEALCLPAIADDSGLVVDALYGGPGVFSARYGGDACVTDEDRYNYLLKRMENREPRTAKFVSVIACHFPNGDIVAAQGEINGEILHEPKGDHGFGYDPIFYIPEVDMTMAEIDLDLKNRISHRAKALQKFVPLLREYIEQGEHLC